MTAGWILLTLAILTIWMFHTRGKNEQLRQYKNRIRHLQESHGGLEQSAATSGRQLDVLLSSVNEVVMRVDATGRVLAANQLAKQRFAMHRQHNLPQSMLLFFRDPDWLKSFNDALKGLPEAANLPNMNIDGRVLSPRLAPLGQDQALLLCVDMTETFKLEAQRRTFLSNLMHDLKTPLTSLLGYARSLDAFGDDKDFRNEAAQVIGDEAKHVNHLLDALLTLDQIEFAPVTKDACCDAVSVLKRVNDLLKPQQKKKDVSISRDISDDEIHVAMEADDLERLLTNVIENALQHSPQQGEVKASLSVEQHSVAMVIEDEGPGIPEKKLDRVTERFYRVDKARGRSAGGHGLGLAIVKELVETHKGSLKLSNLEPHGLRVEVKLPQARNHKA